MVIGLSVGYETWPPIGWHHPFVIGWSKYRLGLPSAPLHYGLTWPVGIPTVFQTPVTVTLHGLTACKCLPLGLCKGTVKEWTIKNTLYRSFSWTSYVVSFGETRPRNIEWNDHFYRKSWQPIPLLVIVPCPRCMRTMVRCSRITWTSIITRTLGHCPSLVARRGCPRASCCHTIISCPTYNKWGQHGDFCNILSTSDISRKFPKQTILCDTLWESKHSTCIPCQFDD